MEIEGFEVQSTKKAKLLHVFRGSDSYIFYLICIQKDDGKSTSEWIRVNNIGGTIFSEYYGNCETSIDKYSGRAVVQINNDISFKYPTENSKSQKIEYIKILPDDEQTVIELEDIGKLFREINNILEYSVK